MFLYVVYLVMYMQLQSHVVKYNLLLQKTVHLFCFNSEAVDAVGHVV